jgi:hypothetical protein
MGRGGGFGTYLVPLFDPKCRTRLEFSKKIEEPGRQGYVYKFTSPPEGCFPTSFTGSIRAYATHEGLVLLELPGGELTQVAERSVNFPQAYPIGQRSEVVTWNFVKIDNETHLLPVAFEKVMYMRQGGVLRVTAAYINHRHFEANSNVTFQ